MTVEWEFAASQILGRREEQEDYCEVLGNDGQFLCVLADGMGGHAAGATAAKLAVTKFIEAASGTYGPVSNEFLPALNAANDAIARHISDNPHDQGMGCTLIAVELDHQGFKWLSVGDSIVLLKTQAGLSRINADHSMAGRLAIAVKNGEITAEEARISPSRHLLLSAVTGEPIHRLDYSAMGRSVAVGDILIIASDGLGSLDNQEIDEILKAQSGVEIGALSQYLLEAVAAKDHPRQDNATVIVARAVKLPDNGKRVP